MAFLAPLFFAALLTFAIPILIHLTQRERKQVVEFPSLMFLEKIPYQSVRRRRIRDWPLLAMRLAAILLIVLAFARPFFATGAAVASSGVTVVALDISYSMSAPGRFDRAKRLAKDAIARAPAGDLVGVVTFADAAEIVAKPTEDRTLAAAGITPGP